MTPPNPYRLLPQVSKVLDHLAGLRTTFSAEAISESIREELDSLREVIKQNPLAPIPSLDSIAESVLARLHRDHAAKLRPVINATGIVLHTNLGRSPIAESAAQAAYEAARGYLDLELDLATGKRSSRQDAIREGLVHLTGSESATAVNNCAAATVLVLRALAAGKEVVVSRGELIEIGGSFRIPEIMAVSGAILREVGTTNITRASDYERAIGPNTALLMRIHTSNFRVRGFTKAVELAELVGLGRKHNLPVIDDVGSGAMFDLAPFGLPGEPVVPESVRAGADLVLFSGDKLFGGPQAGMIVGKAELIVRIERDPMMRAFRLDKMTLAALEATLRLYRNLDATRSDVPTLQMLMLPISELKLRSERFAERLRSIPDLSLTVRADSSFAGGGSLPDIALPTIVLAFSSGKMTAETLATRLRTGSIPVVGRIQNDEFLIDLRTVFERQEDDLVKTIAEAFTNDQ